jgi:hypothetical protein
MNSSVITLSWLQLLLIVAAAALVYVLEGWWLYRRWWRETRAMRDQLFRLATEQERLASRLQELGQVEQRAGFSSTVTKPETPYSQAIRLARQGLSADMVAHDCGISRSEADLIVSLYRSAGS